MKKAAFTTDNKMKISKSKLRQIIKEEVGAISEARDERLRHGDPDVWEQEKSIIMGAPYPDEEALELFHKVSRLYSETGISDRFGRLLPDKDADDVNRFFARRAKWLQRRDDEKNADLPKIIWSYGGEPSRGQPSLEQVQQKHDASEHDYPDPRHYDEETDTKSGIKYWRRKDNLDAYVRAYPLKSGLSPTGAETAEELRGLYPRLINSLEERGALSLVDKYLEEEDDAISALLRALERLA